jgi:predicted MFS family arabinose efflux permease
LRSYRQPGQDHLLALGTFLKITVEYLVAGLVQELADDLHVSLARVGLLITAFAICMIVGSPVMALATLRLPRRATLVLALLVFAAGHIIAALSSDFAIVLIARVVTALAAGAFWSVASVVATHAAGPANSSRALGVMMSGVGLATVVGVPLGAFAGQLLGWRGNLSSPRSKRTRRKSLSVWACALPRTAGHTSSCPSPSSTVSMWE